MKRLLPDKRVLMASYNDVDAFFKSNNIIGKEIADIVPFALDYRIQNLDDIENILSLPCESSIDTDGPICILFTDGNHMEMEFSGDGPIILGYNTADFSKYPKYDGSCYKLGTLFQQCIGKKIKKIAFEKTNHKMLFPCYKGMDMSEDDDGIKQIDLILNDESFLSASGNYDWFSFTYYDSQGATGTVPFTELLRELN